MRGGLMTILLDFESLTWPELHRSVLFFRVLQWLELRRVNVSFRRVPTPRKSSTENMSEERP